MLIYILLKIDKEPESVLGSTDFPVTSRGTSNLANKFLKSFSRNRLAIRKLLELDQGARRYYVCIPSFDFFSTSSASEGSF